MQRLVANPEVIESLTVDPSQGLYATVLLISYRSDEKYTAWMDAMLARLGAAGGRLVWAANAAAPIVGDPDRTWDSIVIVEYPDLPAFLEMIRSRGWADVDGLRVEAMEANEVYGCTPIIDALDHVERERSFRERGTRTHHSDTG